jgi:hypothetical protein
MQDRASWIVACLVLLGVVTGGTASRRAEPAVEVAFAISHDAGMSHKGSGTVIVGWSEGEVVFAMDGDKPEKDLRTGTITPAQLEEVLRDLADAGFFKAHREGSWPPDASHTWITAVREGKKVSYVSDGQPRPPYNAHVESDRETKEWERMWAVSRTALLFAYPRKFVPLKDKPEILARYKKTVAQREFRR